MSKEIEAPEMHQFRSGDYDKESSVCWSSFIFKNGKLKKEEMWEFVCDIWPSMAFSYRQKPFFPH